MFTATAEIRILQPRLTLNGKSAYETTMVRPAHTGVMEAESAPDPSRIQWFRNTDLHEPSRDIWVNSLGWTDTYLAPSGREGGFSWRTQLVDARANQPTNGAILAQGPRVEVPLYIPYLSQVTDPTNLQDLDPGAVAPAPHQFNVPVGGQFRVTVTAVGHDSRDELVLVLKGASGTASGLATAPLNGAEDVITAQINGVPVGSMKTYHADFTVPPGAGPWVVQWRSHDSGVTPVLMSTSGEIVADPSSRYFTINGNRTTTVEVTPGQSLAVATFGTWAPTSRFQFDGTGGPTLPGWFLDGTLTPPRSIPEGATFALPAPTAPGLYTTRIQVGAEAFVAGPSLRVGAVTTAVPGTDAVYFVDTDLVGSVRQITPFPSVGVPYTSSYQPFGLVRDSAGPPGQTALTTVGFAGKERDASGLHYFGARYYDAMGGRFTSPDAPGADQDPRAPQSWNLYSYVRNNPVAFTDPNGRYLCEMNHAECTAFDEALGRARQAAYASDDRKAIASVDSYGRLGIDNGVSVATGSVPNGYSAMTEVGTNLDRATRSNPSGQNIRVTFATGTIAPELIAHEGSHVADGAAWVGRNFESSPTRYQTEFSAYLVQAKVVSQLYSAPYRLAPPNGPMLWSPGQSETQTQDAIRTYLASGAYRQLQQGAFRSLLVIRHPW